MFVQDRGLVGGLDQQFVETLGASEAPLPSLADAELTDAELTERTREDLREASDAHRERRQL
ncbi:hypothetical protein GCM10010339_82940 [Streptomyces alanosinicus]|uniref:Uncharacterized protein n=1 Tax=Streptomyces alanosinicus TaxID=68171 RepID=A0A919D793_9ACTN|nr:hypothetical protein GCM10010339_82940 [Streptomyces alanosinicus]